jgi:hypothetical protein
MLRRKTLVVRVLAVEVVAVWKVVDLTLEWKFG